MMFEVFLGLLVIACLASLVAIQIRCKQVEKVFREFQELDKKRREQRR